MSAMMKTLTSVALVGLFAVAVTAADQPAKKAPAKTKAPKAGKGDAQAKDIFYRPPEQAAAPSAPLALRYQILLKRGNYVSFVPEGFQFQSGDQFRLIFQASSNGYAYIFNRGTSGRGTVLFPDPRINGGDNRLLAHSQCVVPATGWYEFDRRPGIEELLVFYSRTPLAKLQKPAAQRTVERPVWEQTIVVLITQRSKSIKAGKTKDIVYVEEGQSVVPQTGGSAQNQWPNGSPATYVGCVPQDQDNLLIHSIKLRHN